MLELDGAPFCTGRSAFLDAPPVYQESSSKLYVRLRIRDVETLAQLDTGAAWSVITPELADALGLFDSGGANVAISTRHGPVSGKLQRIDVFGVEGRRS
jgi:hypothetical protein